MEMEFSLYNERYRDICYKEKVIFNPKSGEDRLGTNLLVIDLLRNENTVLLISQKVFSTGIYHKKIGAKSILNIAVIKLGLCGTNITSVIGITNYDRCINVLTPHSEGTCVLNVPAEAFSI